jgi:hypothetical protein
LRTESTIAPEAFSPQRLDLTQKLRAALEIIPVLTNHVLSRAVLPNLVRVVPRALREFRALAADVDIKGFSQAVNDARLEGVHAV